MKLRVLLLAITLLIPLALESVHGVTATGDRFHRPVVLLQLAAAEPAPAVPPSATLLSLIASPPVADTAVQLPATNISATRRYEILIRHSAWFRDLRLEQECGTIDSDALKASCRDSFGMIEAMPVAEIRAALSRRD